MRVGVDLDGVYYPFERALAHYLVEYEGFDPAKIAPVTTWGFYQEWGLTKVEFLDAMRAAIDAGVLYAWGEPYEGAREALQRLVDAGHSLHVVTARQGLGTPGRAEGQTMFWLAQNMPPIDSLTFAHDKTIANVDVFIEDKMANYDTLLFAGVRATLINRPWNQQDHDYPWRRRVDTLDEFVDDVLSLKWRVAA